MNQKLGKRRKKLLQGRQSNMESQGVLIPDEPLHYLPQDRHPEIENDLIRARMAAPIRTVDDLKSSPVEGMFAQIASECIAFIKKNLTVTQDIYVAIVRSGARNALAIGRGDLNCIVLSSGYILSLSTLIQNLDRTGVLSKLWKNPQLQFAPEPDNKIIPSRTRREAIEYLLTTFTGLDDIQRNLVLMRFCTEFIAFHELGHIVNGHTRSGIFSTGAIQEISSHQRLDLLRTVRTLELDADAFAVQNSLSRAFTRIGGTGMGASFVRDHQSALVSGIFGPLLTVVAMDSRPGLDATEYERSSHPPPYIRSFEIVASAKAHLERWQAKGAVIPNDYEDILVNVRVYLEAAIAIAGSCAWEQERHDEWMSIIKEHDAKLLSRWAKIRPALEKNKFGIHNLAPAQLAPE